jgi:hypothetical protein
MPPKKDTITMEKVNEMANEASKKAVEAFKQQEKEKKEREKNIFLYIVTIVIIVCVVVGVIFWLQSSKTSQWSNNWAFVPGCVDNTIACVPMPILLFQSDHRFHNELNEATHCCISTCEKAYVEDPPTNWLRACSDTGYFHYRFNRTLYEQLPPPFVPDELQHEDL